MNKGMKNVAFWMLLILLLVSIFFSLNKQAGMETKTISYSKFMKLLSDKKISSVSIQEKRKLIKGTYFENGKNTDFDCVVPVIGEELLKELSKKDVEIKGLPEEQPGFLSSFLLNWGPMLFFILFLWFVFYRNVGGMGKGAFSFGKSRAKLFTSNLAKVTFEDVAGCEESKRELEEIIDFLKDPKKFQKLGGRIPTGVLVVGPPGTGKTLLARAVAGEAGVPFYNISGSDFVEMFVGVGASRVRDLFEQGKKNAPCIVFIDEIDAVGRQRGAGLGGGHDEREQTLNALLVEMDGFETKEGVIIIAATNRPDVLDPALLRPGRFDRIVVVDRPDLKGREGILKVHLKKKPVDTSVDLQLVARGTPGFSGADIENLTNEAALLAARRNKEMITLEELEEAKDKVLMGPERKSMMISDEEKKLTAYHEAGHALVSEMVPDSDPLHKITIIPRGRALGVTVQLPVDERHSYRASYLLSRIAVLLGGRAAEELIFNEITNGAGNDIEEATKLTRKMVCEWGMSDVIGPVAFGKVEEHPFLGKEMVMTKKHSEETASKIDNEIKKLVMQQHEIAKNILAGNKDILIKIADALIEKEVIDGAEVKAIIKGEEIEYGKKVEGQKKSPKISVAKAFDGGKVTFTYSDGLFDAQDENLNSAGLEAVTATSGFLKGEYDKIEDKLKEKSRIEIIGYTDSIGEAEANRVLSLKRAEHVKMILIEMTGIPGSCFTVLGKGEQDPISDNGSLEGRRKNRRVKVIFIEPKKESEPPGPEHLVTQIIGELDEQK